MRSRFVTAFIYLVVFFSNAQCYGQDGYIRWNDNQQLQWDDFTGRVSDTSKFAAETFAEISYQYKSDNLKRFEFEVYANFDKSSSWRRKELQCNDLLKHEQVHFNIAALFAKKLKNEFEQYHYTANYSEQILEIFKKNKLEYQAMQRQYDEETNHSLNKQKQKDWELAVDTELRQINQRFQFASIGEQLPLKVCNLFNPFSNF